MLASLCDRHSQVAATPETHFFSRFYGQRIPRKQQVHSSQVLARLFAECQYTRDLNLSSDDLLEKTGVGEISLDEFFHMALDAYASARGKPLWIEKTPEHLLCADTIFDWYPQARMICIFRDGRDTALSLRNMPWAIAPLRQYAALWRQSAIAMLRCQQKWPERFLSIRYESLLENPVETLTSVMNFAGLEFEPGQLDPTRGTEIVPAWEMPVKKNVFSEIDSRRAYAWRRTATPKQLRAMNSMMRPYLERLGYETDDKRPAWPLQLYDAALNPVFRVASCHELHWLRWWIRVLLNPLMRVSPHYSVNEWRKRPGRVDGPQAKQMSE